MGLELLQNHRHWNARPSLLGGKPATEFHVGWVNELLADETWQEIDCNIVQVGADFEVTRAPFNCSFPALSTGAAFFESDNRWDIFNKSKITDTPFGMSIIALDAVEVSGEVFDINGDGRLDAVIYRQAFPQWDADLIYYVQHGRAPRLKKLVRFNSALSSDIQVQFRIEYTDGVELTPTILQPGQVRVEQIWDGTGTLSPNSGYYVRLLDAPHKRGLGMSDFKIWDSGVDAFGASSPTSQTIDAGLVKDGTGYVLTKYIPAAFFSGATFPVYTDTTSIFYPEGGTNTVDGYLVYGGAAFNQTNWDVAHDAVSSGFNETSEKLITTVGNNTGNVQIVRSHNGFDTSSIPDSDSIDSGTHSQYVIAKVNDDNDGDDYIVLVQTTPASNTALEGADYSQIGDAINNPTEGSADQPDITDITIGAYLDWTLDATGRGWVNKTGITNLGMREGHDAQDILPVLASAEFSRMYSYSANRAGTTQDPKLEVVHSASGPPLFIPEQFGINSLGGIY